MIIERSMITYEMLESDIANTADFPSEKYTERTRVHGVNLLTLSCLKDRVRVAETEFLSLIMSLEERKKFVTECGIFITDLFEKYKISDRVRYFYY